MKRKVFLTIFIFILFLIAYSLGFSQNDIDKNLSEKNINQENINKKDIYKEFSITNTTIGSNSYIHIRELFEKLGFSVKWIDKERAVLIYKEKDFVKLTLNDDYFVFNGRLIKHKIRPIIRKDKVYVTADFLNNVFNNFKYESSTELLTFKSPDIFKTSTKLPSVETKEKLDKLIDYSNQMNSYGKDYDTVETIIEGRGSSLNRNLQSKAKNEVNKQSADHSETNIQVQGVDEADIVKTDGSYIYTLNKNNIYIVKGAKDDFRIVNTIHSKDYDPLEFYIKDNKLITIGYFHGVKLDKQEENNKLKIAPDFSNSLKVLVYDISDKSNTSLLRDIELDGNYLSSRLIDNNFYLVANKGVYYGNQEIRPYYKDSVDKKKSFINYEDIRYFPESVYNNYLITLGLDLNNLDSSKVDVNAYLGSGNNMYVSAESMYISQDKYKYNIYNIDENFYNETTSSIFKFNLENGKTIYSNNGEVPGRILNQFSMDEYKGNFRIATTKGDSWRDNESINNVYVLDENLKLIGKTKDLAPGEKIYSVRFMGDKVYVVTFRQIDPFYVIDLINPKKPEVLGYLKIPGYSSYLHPYDENHIIGIGMDTIDKDGRVLSGGVKISMFDVTDYNNPIELDKIIIGEKGSHTDILHDHKSLLFSKKRNILAFPIYASSYDKGTYKHNFETQGAFVFKIDENYNLKLRGDISHLDKENDYNSYVKRVLFIDNNLYTLSNNKIKISNFDTLENIKELSLKDQ